MPTPPPERTKKQRGVLFQYFEWERKADAGLWRELRAKARELANLGVTAVWMPPPYKTADGPRGEGYAVYDMFDLGEFDQKGSVNTKYGTKDEFLAAVTALREVGVSAYVDVVFNHRMGGDETEEVEVEEIPCDNRHHVMGSRKAKVWSRFTFPGRKGKYSAFQWNAQHFNAFDCIEGEECSGKIFRVKGKQFSDEVDCEHGNYDFLMGADVDLNHPEVRQDLFWWGKWIIETANVDGFRMDAVKHIPSSFVRDWLKHLREQYPDRELFAVAEYWRNDLGLLKKYLHDTEAATQLFDVPLHYRFHEAAKKGRDFDLRTIFDGTLVQSDPFLAVTFVDNHDTQPGQSLQSPIDDWFKQHAYALTMLRRDGYPAVFYRDYFGPQDPEKPGVKHVKLIADMLQARKNFTWGEQHDYLDHPNCIGWTWTGDEKHSGSMAVLMSSGDNGCKKMKTHRPGTTYRDITSHMPEPITTDDNGEAEFCCPGGKVSIWCSA
jgi:alpha-amylase